ncbi:hypothetical protein Hypma_014555 [Hypsizygus marmoreus]|uniref:Uncharacterized protein n=1 Tax=Hypsizygus marmoreus TaxID=39966 RepID=A0A369JE76_HYPMA|nr:hypothetical protein Hypma_014555 [Hypsizygus marmoreus]
MCFNVLNIAARHFPPLATGAIFDIDQTQILPPAGSSNTRFCQETSLFRGVEHRIYAQCDF